MANETLDTSSLNPTVNNLTNRIIYWFRNDLRLNDNEAFWSAAGDSEEIIPVYVFDPRRFRFRDLGFRRTGINRARHMLEAVSNLQRQLHDRGSSLIIKVGEPEMIIAELARHHDVSEVRASKEITLEETNIEASLSKKLKGINVDISLMWMNTLIHPHDLPFYISRLPEHFDLFVSMVRSLPVRSPVPDMKLTGNLDPETLSQLPGLSELGFTEEELIAEGELQGICMEEEEIKSCLSAGKAGADEILNWISFGVISPRQAYHQSISTESGPKLFEQLLWRDYLQFVALRYGSRLFKPSGLTHKIDRVWKYDRDLFNQWRQGETSDPAVNKFMKQLMTTGVISLAQTQQVAQYLAETLGVNWTWGASWFESCLKSYEVTFNWGNWNYFAGVGPGIAPIPDAEKHPDTV